MICVLQFRQARAHGVVPSDGSVQGRSTIALLCPLFTKDAKVDESIVFDVHKQDEKTRGLRADVLRQAYFISTLRIQGSRGIWGYVAGIQFKLYTGIIYAGLS
jgi:hypothetical protein